ncbi:MAG: hypothetical protein PWQ55_356 [Chloroflexota bacterium]|nr:hypothetical protein [Chloroflexota bacterium]
MLKMPDHISRRDFIRALAVTSTALIQASCGCQPSIITRVTDTPQLTRPVVSIVKIGRGLIIKNEIFEAVERAIFLLGGIERIAANKHSIMLKPNLVNDAKKCTTNPHVVNALASLMKEAGFAVSIGEGSAGADVFSTGPNCYIKDPEILAAMQQAVFERLGYADFAGSLGVDLVNLHTGEMVDVNVPDGLAYDELTISRSVIETDLLCSVPMMKTHERAVVTLGMKNLIGLYPGTAYGSIRSTMHDHALAAGSKGVSYEIIDMVKAIGNKFGLVVIDGSTAMEGNGPVNGDLVNMNVIIAGTNPLATDIVAASVMGYEPEEVPHFVQASKSGMQPFSLDDIEVRGETIDSVRRRFKRPVMNPWGGDSDSYHECE